MKAILSADLNWAIGCNGDLLQRIPDDIKYFREMTLGKVVIMGRKTYESLPSRAPLKDRINIVLTTNNCFQDDRFIVCCSLDELFETLKNYSPEDIFIIGGQAVYTQLLPYCTEVYVTKIDKAYKADKYFPNLDEHKDWKCELIGEANSHNDVEFRFCKYINKEIKDMR